MLNITSVVTVTQIAVYISISAEAMGLIEQKVKKRY